MLEAIFVWFALLLLLSIHELGHFCAARLVGVRVLQLSFGVGPPLCTVGRIGGTQVRVRVFPIAAYAGLAGHVEGNAGARETGYYQAERWKRCAIDVAGPLANYLLAAAIVFVLSMQGFFGEPAVDPSRASRLGESLRFAVAIPWELTRAQFDALCRVVFSGEVGRVEGVVRIGRMLVDEARRGGFSFASALVILSVAIGFFNLLPVPGLDGGKLVVIAMEKILGRRVPPRVLAKAEAVSLAVLLLLLGLLAVTEMGFPILTAGGVVLVPVAAGGLLRALLPTPSPRLHTVVIGSYLAIGLGALVVGIAVGGAYLGVFTSVVVIVGLGVTGFFGWVGYRGAKRFAS